MKILIVDDHALTRRFIRLMIAPLASEIYEASEGLESVRLCSQLKPDFVTMDLVMEGMDGLEATRRIRAACPDSRVIVVSSHEDPELREAVKASGACHYVNKDNLGELVRYLEAADLKEIKRMEPETRRIE